LLDTAARERVEALLDEMSERFGVGRGFPGGVPHVTFHLSERDTEPGAAAVVESVAKSTLPFRLYSAGLGAFAGPSGPILHLSVARAPAAATLAERLGQELSAAGFPGTDPYYTPERWIPHITIAQQNLDGADLPGLLAWLVEQRLAMEIAISELSIARESPTGVEILASFPLGR
jgi:2'-5' RNA ligase